MTAKYYYDGSWHQEPKVEVSKSKGQNPKPKVKGFETKSPLSSQKKEAAPAKETKVEPTE